MGADFTPDLGDYSGIRPFRFWCQKVLPLVYDDSLSYYELLCKVVDYLNKAIEDVATAEGNIEELNTAYLQLQGYVNDYFENLDVQEQIDEKLDSMSEDGTLARIFTPIVSDVTANWLATHITPTSPAVDSSLTVNGAAANSKTVGDRALLNRGGLTSSDDLDYIVDIGTWYAALTNDLPLNWPFSITGRLLVLGSTTKNRFTKVQLAINSIGSHIRYRIGTFDDTADSMGYTGRWTEWIEIANDTTVDEILDIFGRAVQPYDTLVTNDVWVANGWTTVDDLPSNRLIETDTSLIDDSYGLAVTGKYSTIMTLHANRPTSGFGRTTIQSAGSEIWIKNSQSGWVELTGIKDLYLDASNLKSSVESLSRISEYVYTPSWEQGTFDTPSWVKGNSSNALYNRFIRFANYPSIAGIYSVRVEVVNGDYTVYVGIKGASAAVSKRLKTGESYEHIVPDNLRTLLNVSAFKGVYADAETITPTDGENIKVTFVPILHTIKSITNEIDGILIRDETTPIKIGIYGASIVAGYGVSDYSNNLNGDLVQLSLVGGSDFRKYSGTKSWANMFKGYIEEKYPNVSVNQWAVSGSTASSYYQYLLKSMNLGGSGPLDTNVDIAIIMMGNNGRGSSMETNIAGFVNIINLFKSRGAEVFMVTPTPAFNGSYRLNTYQIMMCVKAAAQNAGCVTVDAFAWLDNAVKHPWVEDYQTSYNVNLQYNSIGYNFLNSDNLHPSDLGHKMLFACMKNLLKV